MMEKLKPCPFCGSENIELVAGDAWPWVRCRSCLASSAMEDAEEDAIEKWNRRANDEK